MFPRWEADPKDPDSYDFSSSDERIRAIVENGFRCFFRLGTSWKGRNIRPISGHEEEYQSKGKKKDHREKGPAEADAFSDGLGGLLTTCHEQHGPCVSENEYIAQKCQVREYGHEDGNPDHVRSPAVPTKHWMVEGLSSRHGEFLRFSRTIVSQNRWNASGERKYSLKRKKSVTYV